MRRIACAGLALMFGCADVDGDTPPIQVAIDATHSNLHTLDGSFTAFGRVVRERGREGGRTYRVRGLNGDLTLDALADVDVLVIAGAREADPLTRREVNAIDLWVRSGGALFLVADHHPYPAAVANLADTFGFELMNGWVHDGTRHTNYQLSRTDGTLFDHPLTNGPYGRVDVIHPGGSAAFGTPREAAVVAELPPHMVLSMPEEGYGVTWPGAGLAVLAAVRAGAGRVVVSAEASMLTCRETELDGLMGFCGEGNEDQEALVLNAVHWLADR